MKPMQGEARRMIDHPPWRVERREGGFRLLAQGVAPVEARLDAHDGSFTVHGLAESPVARLTRDRGDGGGFVLVAGETELGRTMVPLGLAPEETGLRHVLLDDGRLFRILPRVTAEDGPELAPWEVGGAYLRARPDPPRWLLVPLPSSGGIPSLGALSLLFAAELLDAEQTQRKGT
jgi:hypothetical protein